MCVVWEGFISELTAIPFPQWLALSQASCPTLCGGVNRIYPIGGHMHSLPAKAVIFAALSSILAKVMLSYKKAKRSKHNHY